MNAKTQNSRQLESLDLDGLLGRPLDPVAEAKQIAARSRRRCAFLAIATAAAWVVACGTAIFTSLLYFSTIRRQQALIEYRYAEKHAEVYGIPWEQVTERQKDALHSLRRNWAISNSEILVLVPVSISLFGVAALLSIWLTIASRRVALRQINANLLAITTELRQVVQNGVVIQA